MRKVVDKFCYEEWEFDTAEECEAAATKEAHVCGDHLRISIDGFEIYNYHQQGVRWKGRVK